MMNPLLDTVGLALYDQLLKAVAGGSLELKDGKLILKSVDGTVLGETAGIVCSVNGINANAGNVVITSVENATKASKDADGNVISSTYLKSATASSTYLTKTDAASTYLGKTAKAASATTADSATSAASATKATQDGDGNTISSTYLKKTDAASTYLGKTAKAASAATADSATTAASATKATQDGDGNVISSTYLTKSDASGTYATSETVADHTDNKSNPHGVTKAQVGLGNVTNESKATMFTSPAFTGAPTAPTAAAGTNTTQLATTAFVTTAIANKTSVENATNSTNATKATQDGNGNVIADTYLTKAGASETYLAIDGKAESATVADSANAVTWDNVTGKPGSFTPSAHNQASSTINALTGYAKASTASALSTNDTLNGALGKLEKALDGKLGTSANAASASKWATARTITLSGDASGSVSIDGSENKTLTVTVADDSHNHIISNVDGLQSALDGKASTSSVETALATAKSYTDTAVANLVDSAPETLNTIGEVAAALQANEDVTDALNEAIGSKANASEVVKLSGNQTIAGTKTFSSTISGSINGNASTATKATQDGSGNVITSTYLTKSDASSTYLGKTAKAASATVADSANAVAWDNVSGKPDSYTPASHNQASSTINALTGYAKASAASALSTSDTLNGALGKLEKALDGKLSTSGTAAKATADADGNTISSTYLKKTDASSTYLGKTAKASSAAVADSANAVAWANVSDKPSAFAPASHNQASSTIDALTGYSKPSSTSALAATDTLNSALGKLEKALDGKLFTTGTAAKATADASGNVITSTYATKTEVSTVSTTASDAASAASTAQTTANEAKTAASAAQSTANTAKTTADAAFPKASLTYGTTDMTAGTSTLATGSIYLMYE